MSRRVSSIASTMFTICGCNVPIGGMLIDMDAWKANSEINLPGTSITQHYSGNLDVAGRLGLIAVNGFDLGEGYNAGESMTIPWSAFQTDGTYEEIRERLAGDPWLAAIDAAKTAVDNVHDGQPILVYMHLIDEWSLPSVYPLSKAPTVNFDDVGVPEEHGRLAAFIVEHYGADYFCPFVEVNRWGNNHIPELLTAYSKMEEYVHAYDPGIKMFVSFTVGFFYTNAFSDHGGLNATLQPTSNAAFSNAAAFIEASGSNACIAFSLYTPQAVTADVLEEGTSGSDIGRVIDGIRTQITDKSWYDSLPVCMGEMGYIGWTPVEAPVVPDPEEQARQLAWLTRYTRGDHYMEFINNYIISDYSGTLDLGIASSSGTTPSGLFDEYGVPKFSGLIAMER